MRATTLADARKLNLLPSVTTILGILAKPGLVAWQVEQACLSVLTAPRKPDEPLDVFVDRVLNIDKDQQQESEAAMRRGTDVHEAIEHALRGMPYGDQFKVFVEPTLKALELFGPVVSTEEIVVGQGYAGRLDYKSESAVVDFKTCKKLPKAGYREHELQLSAYAKAAGKKRVANIYIATEAPGDVRVIEYFETGTTFAEGFMPAMLLWQWMNEYYPDKP